MTTDQVAEYNLEHTSARPPARRLCRRMDSRRHLSRQATRRHSTAPLTRLPDSTSSTVRRQQFQQATPDATLHRSGGRRLLLVADQPQQIGSRDTSWILFSPGFILSNSTVKPQARGLQTPRDVAVLSCTQVNVGKANHPPLTIKRSGLSSELATTLQVLRPAHQRDCDGPVGITSRRRSGCRRHRK
jgi:hypothetical protein